MKQTSHTNTSSKKILLRLILAIIFVFSFHFSFVSAQSSENSQLTFEKGFVGGESEDVSQHEVDQLNREIEDRKQRILEVEQKKKELQDQLNIIERQTYSIQNQLSAIGKQIEDTEFEIEKKTIELEQKRLEIAKLEEEIKIKEEEIVIEKERLGAFIRLIDQNDRVSPLFVLLSRDSFSSYVDDVRSAADLQVKIQTSVKELRSVKEELNKQKEDQQNIEAELEDTKSALERNRETLTQQKDYQHSILEESKQREIPFEELIDQVNKEESYANSQVKLLEDAIREKLLVINKGLISDKNVPLSWPVIKDGLNARSCAAFVTCSATFYDPDYYQYFKRQHNGVDVPLPQGTPVYAPADGYVVGVVHGFSGGGIGSLSILKIEHTDDQGIVTNMGTKYLHMSNILVSYNPENPQHVKQGELLGYSGGLPGTKGSGTRSQSTGPHLHFEVLIDGFPVNPLTYLP